MVDTLCSWKLNPVMMVSAGTGMKRWVVSKGFSLTGRTNDVEPR